MTAPHQPHETEDMLPALMRDLYRAMKHLSKHALVSKPAWTVFDRAWDAARRRDSARFEECINDLDSLTHLHHFEALDRETAAHYAVTRHLIRCVQGVSPYSFACH